VRRSIILVVLLALLLVVLHVTALSAFARPPDPDHRPYYTPLPPEPFNPYATQGRGPGYRYFYAPGRYVPANCTNNYGAHVPCR
jgi:hypothetical protein